MNLPIYSSTSDRHLPNLVGLQHPALAALPTQLVCPMQTDIALTPLRERAKWNGRELIVACDLIHPIRSTALHPIGSLDNETSKRILQTFKMMLAEAD